MTKDEEVDGAKIAADILNAMNPSQKERIVTKISNENPEIADKISEKLFRFDDIADLPARGLQVLAQSVNHHDLVLALKKAEDATKNAIYANVSERKRDLLKDDEQSEGKTSLKEVYAAQRRIMKTLDELERNGKIVDDASERSKHDIWV